MILAGLFLISLLFLHFMLNYQMDKIIGRTVRTVVNYRSNGIYRLSYQKMSINLLRNRIEIKDLVIKGDTQRYRQRKTHNLVKNSLFDIKIPHVEIKGLNIWKVLFYEKLEIGNFYLHHPQVHIIDYPNQKKREERLKINNLYRFFSDYLNQFRIEHLEVSNGSCRIANPKDISKLLGKIDSISLIAKQIKIDSTNQPQYSLKPLEVADIELNIKRNMVYIPENELEISMGELRISTQKAFANLSDLKVKNNTSEVEIPLVRLSGIDIHQLYFSKNLKINKLWLKNPSIRVKNTNTNTSPLFTPYALISKYLASLGIGQILMEKANIDLALKNTFSVKGASFLMTNFYIDSLAENHHRHFYCDNLTGKIPNYEILLPDNLHLAKIEEIRFSTTQSMIYGKGINVNVIPSKKDLLLPNDDLFQLILPTISLKSKNLWENLLNQSLNFEELVVKSPQIQLFKRLSTLPTAQIGTVIPKLALNIKKISLENASIYYHQWREVNHEHRLDKVFHALDLSAQVDNLSLHEKKYFDHLTIRANNLHWNSLELQHTFLIDNFSFSSLSKNLFFNDLKSFPHAVLSHSNRGSASGRLALLSLENFDIHQLYQGKILKASKLTLHQPSLALITKFDSLAKQSNFFLKSIEFQEVNLINGKVNWHQNHLGILKPNFITEDISAKFKEVAFHQQESFKSKSVKRIAEDTEFSWSLGDAEIKLQNYVFTFPDSSHTVRVGKVDFNYAKSIATLEQISLKPARAKQAEKNQFKAEIPSIQLEVKDLQNITKAKDWVIERLLINKPAFDFSIDESNIASTQTSKMEYLFAKLPFNKLFINHLQIDSSSTLLTYKQANQKLHHLALMNFNLQLNNFEIDSAKHQWGQLFDLEHIKLSIGNYNHFLPDHVHQLTANNITLFSSDSSLTIQDFYIKPFQKIGIPYTIEVQDKANTIDIYTPKIHLQGWDIKSFLEDKKLHLSNVSIATPLLNLQIHRPDTTQKLKNFTQKLHADSLYEIISPFVKDLKIKKLALDNGHLSLITHHQSNMNTFVLDSISIKATKFDIHPITYHFQEKEEEDLRVLPPPFLFDPTPYQFLNTENIELSIKNYTFKLPDKEHIFKAKSIYLSTKDSVLTADNVLFMPILDKITFSKNQAYKKAWLFPQIRKLTINQFDFYDFLHHQEIKMRSLLLDTVRFEIYRDRSLPNRTDYFPPMPQDLLKELPFFVKVDSIIMKRGNIIYEEKLATKERPGKLTFENTDAHFTNITNHPDSLKKHDFQAVLAGNTYIMGQGKFDIEARFFLSDAKNLHWLKGELSEMQMTSFNEMLEYVFPVRIKSGIIKTGKFDLKLNDRSAKGKMWLKYNDLKVEVINRKFASFVANSFVVTNHNPSRTFAPLRVGEMNSRRNPSRSIFSYWGYSVLNGFKTSIGLRGKKQQKKSKFDKNKKKKDRKLKMRKKKETTPKSQVQ